MNEKLEIFLDSSTVAWDNIYRGAGKPVNITTFVERGWRCLGHGESGVTVRGESRISDESLSAILFLREASRGGSID